MTQPWNLLPEMINGIHWIGPIPLSDRKICLFAFVEQTTVLRMSGLTDHHHDPIREAVNIIFVGLTPLWPKYWPGEENNDMLPIYSLYGLHMVMGMPSLSLSLWMWRSFPLLFMYE